MELVESTMGAEAQTVAGLVVIALRSAVVHRTETCTTPNLPSFFPLSRSLIRLSGNHNKVALFNPSLAALLSLSPPPFLPFSLGFKK